MEVKFGNFPIIVLMFIELLLLILIPTNAIIRRGEKPMILEAPESTAVIVKERMVMKCLVDGNPAPIIEWIAVGLDDKFGESIKIPRGSILKIPSIPITNHLIKITCSSSNPLGRVNSEAELKVYNSIQDAPIGFPYFDHNSTVMILQKSESAELPCLARGDPEPKITWYKNFAPINMNNNQFVQADDGTLFIKNLDESDEGNYMCEAKNSHGTRISEEHHLLVREREFLPRFITIPSRRIIINPGSDVFLNCTAVGNPVPKVNWFRNSKELGSTSESFHGTSQINLLSITQSENVSCIANSKIGSVVHKVSVLVKKMEPSPKDILLGEITANTAEIMIEETQLETDKVHIIGYIIHWTNRGNLELDTLKNFMVDDFDSFEFDKPVKFAKVWTMRLSNTTKKLDGDPAKSLIHANLENLDIFTEYSVVARSMLSDGFCSELTNEVIFMTKEKAPDDPPSSVSAIATSKESASVTWLPPKIPNGIVRKYKIYYRRRNSNEARNELIYELGETNNLMTSKKQKFKTDVHNLLPDQIYDFEVSAINSAGESPLSDKFEVFIKPGVLPAPRNITVSVKSYDQVILQWNKPPVSDDLISSYLLQIFRLEGQKMEQIKNETLSKILAPVLIDSLTPDTEYKFKMAAISKDIIGLFAESNAKTRDYVAPQPFNLSVTPQGSSSLTIQWRYPKSDMSIRADGRRWKVPEFLSFDLTCQPTDDNGKWLSDDKTADWPQSQRKIEKTVQLQSGGVFDSLDASDNMQKYSEVISHLRPNTYYVVYLKVKTILGYGLRASSKAVKTWPEAPKKPENFQVKVYLASTKNKYSIEALWNPDKDLGNEIFGYILTWRFVKMNQNENLNPVEDLTNITKINPKGLLPSKFQPSLVKISDEISLNKTQWSLNSMEFLPGSTYNFTVKAITQNQLGEESYFLIEIPEISPTDPPINLRVVKTQLNQSIVFWDPMNVDKRGGSFDHYLLSCKDDRIFLADKTYQQGIHWPSGYVIIDRAIPMATGKLSCKVAAFNKVGQSPWSKSVTVDLPKKFPPFQPTNLQAILDGKRVFISWLPNKNDQTPVEKYRIEIGRHHTASKTDSADQIVWDNLKTQGPLTSTEVIVNDDKGQIYVRMSSIGFNGQESLHTMPYLVKNVTRNSLLPINLNAISCNQANSKSLNLLWSFNAAVANKISHFKINYTYSTTFLHTNGQKYIRESSEREIIESPILHSSSIQSKFQMTQQSTQLQALPKAIYSISILPILLETTQAFIPPVAYFNCPITESQAPLYVSRPTFVNKTETGQTFIIIDKVPTINGPIDYYEILLKKNEIVKTIMQINSNIIERNTGNNFQVEIKSMENSRFKRSNEEQKVLLNNIRGNYAIKVCSASMKVEENACTLSEWADTSDLTSWIYQPNTAVNMINFKDLVSSEKNFWPTDNVKVFSSNMENSPQLDDSNQEGTSNSDKYKIIFGSTSLPSDGLQKFSTRITLKTVAIFIGTFITFFCLSCLLFVFIIRRKKQKNLERVQKSSKYSLVKWSQQNGKTREHDQLSSIYKSYSNNNNSEYLGTLPVNEVDLESIALKNKFMYSTYNGELIGAKSLSGMPNNYTANGSLIHPIPNGYDTNSVKLSMLSTRQQGSMNSLNGSLSGRSRFPMINNNQLSPQMNSIFSNRPHTSLLKPYYQTEFSTMIKLQDLHEHVSMLKMNSGHLLSLEFESIDPGGQYCWEHSQHPSNEDKNRYANVIAYDHTRVVLSEIPNRIGSDYINANYIDGWMRRKSYIATQGPMPNTFNDFWRMVWENNSSCIVAITNLEEKNRVKCDQYWPAQAKALPQNETAKNNRVDVTNMFMTHSVTFSGAEDGTFYRSSTNSLGSMSYGNIQVTNLSINEFAYYTIRVFEVMKIDTKEKRIVKHFQYTSWSDHFIPNNAGPFFMFLRRIRQITKNMIEPVIVHCSAGVGRTGTFIGSDILLSQMEYEDYVNVHEVVTKLRSQRKFMIQTQDQYCFIYEVLLEYLDAFDKEIPISSFDNVFESNLMKMNQLNNEFRLLNNRTITSSISDPACSMNKGLISPVEQANISEKVFKLTSSFRNSEVVVADSSNIVALQPINTGKNRSYEIVPYNSNRVVLAEIRGLPGSDYINASLIDGYSKRLAYIAAQAPTEETFEEFWRMIWEAEIRIIVKMNSDHNLENKRSYWPTNETLRFGFLIIDSIAVFEMNFYKIREFSITDTREGHSRTVRQFDVTDALHSIPNTLINCNDFSNIPLGSFSKISSALIECIDQVNVTKTQFGIESPILVHCEFGAGYTGVYICVSILLEMIQHEKTVDVFSTSKILRWQRRGLVENILDYILCYSSISEYLKNYN